MRRFIYGGLVSAALLFASCGDTLDIVPNDSYSDAIVWQDQNLIKMFVNDQYGALIGQDNWYRLSFFSDEVYAKYNDEGCNYIRENMLTSDNVGAVGDVLNFWNSGYKYLHNLNVFFENIQTANVDEEFKKTMIGEMKFIRAFIYFRLIRSYGGVPIIEEAFDINSDWSGVKRSSYDECVDYIVKDLDEVCAYVLLHPLVEQATKEVPPLLRADREVRQRRIHIGRRSQVTSIRVGQDTFYDRCKLNVMASYFLEETIKLHGIIGVIVVHYGHAVPLHAMFLQEVDALHHFMKRRASLLVAPIFVMELLRSVYGDAHQPIVFLEEVAPLIGQKRAVRLDAIINGASVGILLLQLHGPFVERKGTHQRFSAVPGEEHLGHGLRVDIFLDELFQQFLAHHVPGVIPV